MRLLEILPDGDFRLTEFPSDGTIPPYAILSHTWGDENEEVTFEDIDMKSGRVKSSRRRKDGYKKLKFCGEQAARDGLQHFWVDSCCINKKIYAELQDAISSMFCWYQRSAKCYVYLSDVPEKRTRTTWAQTFWQSRRSTADSTQAAEEQTIRQSKWFTRGWTLQELLAPTSVEFFSNDARRLGDKRSLEQQIHEITGIPKTALQGEPLSRFTVNERMRWMEPRQTTRVEDLVYSLLGIFGVNMSLRYGEGKVIAFERLQKEIQRLEECCRNLRLIDPFYHKQDIEHKRGGLLKDSYRWVLAHSDFQTWHNGEQSRLLWIKGDPGKGKTMLLCGIIDELESLIAKTALLSFFFCVATDTQVNTASAVLRGLAYMLVCQQPSLVSHIQKKYDGAGKAVFEDASSWFALSDMFTDMLQDQNLHSAYLIIDALDECAAEDLPKLLDFIVKKSSAYPRAKWIVSSRNWPSIEKKLSTAAEGVWLSLELNEGSVSTAVDSFVQARVNQLAEENEYDSDTRDAVQNYLLSNANGTFLWVALVCQELAGVAGWDAEELLNAFPPGLDLLYKRMLDDICSSKHVKLCKSILAVVSAVRRPITLDELESLVEIPARSSGNYKVLAGIIRLCGSFLTLQKRTISFVHQSAKDFLVDKEKGFNEIYPSGINYVHHIIFSRSLQVLLDRLKRDVYRLGSPGFPIEQVKQPDLDPLSPARYSCVYWIDHLLDCNPIRNANNDLQDGGSVDKFLRQKFLYWLEALSLCQSMSKGVHAMSKLEAVIQVKFGLATRVMVSTNIEEGNSRCTGATRVSSRRLPLHYVS
jgi:hypothetical protein